MKFLLTFYKVVRKATDGKHTPRGVTAVSRLIVICLSVGFGILPILGHAIHTAPAGLWLIVGLGWGSESFCGSGIGARNLVLFPIHS